ncbi:MAG: copper chaperone PCu(A)C, partial [Dokdonella sp.]
MHCMYRGLAWIGLALLCTVADVRAAGKLGVTDAWIRVAPPGANSVAGYATLKNTGDDTISILTVQSDAYRMTSLHETLLNEGISKMRELHRMKIAPGETIQLKPGGKHLMLMQPRREILVGDKVEMLFMLVDGSRIETYFDVVAAASGGD